VKSGTRQSVYHVGAHASEADEADFLVVFHLCISLRYRYSLSP
jgi:hypothetical protein